MKRETVGVLGTGQMGAGIAQVAAAAGHDVVLADVSRQVAEKAKAGIAQRLTGAVEKGKMSRATADGILGRVHPGSLRWPTSTKSASPSRPSPRASS